MNQKNCLLYNIQAFCFFKKPTIIWKSETNSIKTCSISRFLGDVILPDDIEERFRKKVFEKFGMKRGNVPTAIQEAIE